SSSRVKPAWLRRSSTIRRPRPCTQALAAQDDLMLAAVDRPEDIDFEVVERQARGRGRGIARRLGGRGWGDLDAPVKGATILALGLALYNRHGAAEHGHAGLGAGR